MTLKTKLIAGIWADLDSTWVKMDFTSYISGYIIYRDMYFYTLKFTSHQTLAFLFPKPLYFFLPGKKSKLLSCLMSCETREFDKGCKTVHQSDSVN